MAENKPNFLLNQRLASSYSSLSDRLSMAKSVDPVTSSQGFALSGGNEADYFKMRGNSDAVSYRGDVSVANKMSSFPQHDKLWGDQRFLDMSHPHMDDVISRVGEASRMPKPKDGRDAGAFELFYDRAMRSYLTQLRGQAVTEGDRDSELRIMKRLEQFEDIEADGFVESVSAGLGEITGSMASSAYEIVRNQGILMAAGHGIKAAPHPVAKAIGTAITSLPFGSAASGVGAKVGLEVAEAQVAPGAANVATWMSRAATAEAVFEDSFSAKYGNDKRLLEKERPDLTPEEVESRVLASAALGSGVASAGFLLGVPQGILKGFASGATSLMNRGQIAPHLIDNPNLLRKVISKARTSATATSKAALVTVGELSTEKLEDLIVEAAVELEGELENPHIALARYSTVEMGKDIANLLNPAEELNQRNKDFLGDTEDMRNAMFVSALLGYSIGSSGNRYSDLTKVEKTGYQQNLEDTEVAVEDNRKLREHLINMKRMDQASSLKSQSPAADEMLRKSIGENTSLSMDPEDFMEMTQSLLENDSIPTEDKTRVKSLYDQMRDQAMEAVKNGTKVDVPYEIYSGIFQTNEDVFNQSLDSVSVGQDGFSKKDIERAVKDRFEAKSVELLSRMEEDYVYNEMLDVLADDVKIQDSDKQAIAAATQIMFSNLAKVTGEGRTAREVWRETGLQIQLDSERVAADRTAFRKVFDRLRGIDPTIKDPAQAVANVVGVQRAKRERVKDVAEIRKFLKEQDKPMTPKRVAKIVGGEPKTVLDVIKKVGGISSGLTSTQLQNVRDAAKKSRGRKRLLDFYPTEVVNALGEDLARKHIKQDGVGLDDLAVALHEAGFFPDFTDPAQIDTDAVIDVISDVNSYNPDVEAQLASTQGVDESFSEDLDFFGITAESTDAEIQSFIDTQNKLFDEAQAKAEKGQVFDDIPFFQEGTRGSFSSANNLIKIAESGDATTYMHEFMHFFVSELERNVSNGQATAEWVKNYETLREWAKATEGESINAEVNREANERIVSGFERYLAEGRAPIAGLSDLFAHIKDMFMSVYQSIKRIGVPINDDIRNVYDQMFAAHEDIKKANVSNGNKVVAKPEGVSDAFYDAYMTEQVKGNAKASNKVFQQRLKDIETKTTERIKDIEARERARITAELNDSDIYRLIDVVKEDKINVQSLKDNGIDTKLLPNNFKSKEGGWDVALLAETNGYDSAGKMVDEISQTPKKEELINFKTEEAVHKVIVGDKSRVTPMKAATDRSYFSATVRKAMMFGGRAEAEFETIKDTVIEQTTDGFLKTKMRKAVNPNHWRGALLRHNTNATQAFNTGDKDAAYKHGIYAAISQLNSEFSVVAADNARKFDKVVRGITGSQANIKNLGQENFDTIAAILNNFRLKDFNLTSGQPVDKLIDSFMDRMVKLEGLQDVRQLDDYKQFLVTGGNFRDMSYRDFAVLSEIITKMTKLSRQSQIIKRLDEKLTIQEAVDEIKKTPVKIKVQEKGNGLSNAIASLYLNVTSMPTFVHDTFGSAFVDKYLLPFKNGMARASILNDQMLEDFTAIMSKHGVEFNDKKTYVEGIGNLSNDNLLTAALNMVSDRHNRENYYKTLAVEFSKGPDGDRDPKAVLSREQILSLQKAIPDSYYEAANAVIQEVYAPIYTPLRDAIQRRTGIRIAKVEGTKFKTPNGKTYNGGYFPATKSITKVEVNEDPKMAGVALFGVYSSGITKERTQAVTGNLDLTTRTMVRSFYNISMQMEVLEHHNNIGKILEQRVQMEDHLGKHAYDEVVNWHEQAIKPNVIAPRISALDGAFKVYVLGGRMTTAMIQLLGIIPSAAIVGPQWVLPQLVKFAANPTNLMFSIKKASKKSEYMDRRFTNGMSVIFGALESEPAVQTAMQKYGETAKSTAMYMISYMDAIASTITWEAEFNKRKAQGMAEKQAILRADEAVRQTQGDFSKYAKPKIMQGFGSFLTPFMTYFTAMGTKVFTQLAVGERSKAMGLTASVILISPVLEALVREGLVDEEDAEEDFATRVADRAMFQTLSTFGNMVMPVAGLGGTAASYIMEGRAYANEAPFVQSMKAMYEGVRASVFLPARAVGFDVGEEKDTTESLTFDIVRGIGATTGTIPKNVIDSVEKVFEEQ